MTTMRQPASRAGPRSATEPLAAWVADASPWDGAVRYGPGVDDDATLRLLGQLSGKRLLLLGCGSGQLVAEVVRRGAKVIGLEPDAALLGRARGHCAAAGLPVELYERDMAELASVRADTVDLVLSVLELSSVADLSRVFRQVHRVLRPEAPLVLSLPHPARLLAVGATSPLAWQAGEISGIEHGHSIEDVFTALVRTGFRVDNLLELHDDLDNPFPAVLVMRARRLGARPAS